MGNPGKNLVLDLLGTDHLIFWGWGVVSGLCPQSELFYIMPTESTDI